MRLIRDRVQGDLGEPGGSRLQGETISRASVINFLESMREAGVLKGEEKTGKGGHRWIYSPAMNEAEFKQSRARCCNPYET